MRAVGKRVALIALGFLLSAVAVEVLLQLGALAVRLTGRELPTGWATQRPRLVCLGDSNTYGLYVGPDESYPRQLERLIGSAAAAPSFEVLNLGFPGNNSSAIRAALPRVLSELRPQMVAVMIGGNDWWTEPVAASDAVPTTLGDVLYQHSRLYRLLYMVGRSLRSPKLTVTRADDNDNRHGEATISYGDTTINWHWQHREGGTSEWAPLLRENLRAMVAEARAAGVELVFLTYPSEQKTYALANIVTREVAAETATPLIDLGLAFRDSCPKVPCPAIFYADNHPTAEGYRLAAEHILDWLVAHQHAS